MYSKYVSDEEEQGLATIDDLYVVNEIQCISNMYLYTSRPEQNNANIQYNSN